MLQNMFKMAWRNAVRQKQFTILNLLGLSIGITASLFITLYITDELSYDNFHEKADRIYRVNQPFIWGDRNQEFGSTGPGVGLALAQELPEIEKVVRIHQPGEFIVTSEEGKDTRSFEETDIFHADEGFFKVFSFGLIAGNPEDALKKPHSIVITASTARKYFGTTEALGKVLELKQGNGSEDYQVTGIVADLPANSHIDFDFLISMSSNERAMRQNWSWLWTTFVTYILVEEEADISLLRKKMQEVPPKHAATTTQRIFNQTYEEYVAAEGSPWTLYLQPISKIYLHSTNSGNRLGPIGNIQYVYIFSAIGLLILVLSSVNFMNLATAQSARRAKEVGVRKVLGSQRKSLITQFIFESVLFTAISTAVALMIAAATIRYFNTITSKSLSVSTNLSDPLFVVAISLFVLFLGLLAGSYPAFYLSSFKPVQVLKGKFQSSLKGKLLRNTLVVFQFTISIGLIICAFFVQKQLSYTRNHQLGFDKDNLLVIHNAELLGESLESFKNSLQQNPFFKNVTISDAVPPHVGFQDKYKPYGSESHEITIDRIKADEDFMNTLGLEIIAGRGFSQAFETDRMGVVLNESAVKALGWGTTDRFAEDPPVGKYLLYPGGNDAKFEVIGVVKDFNFASLQFDISPLAFFKTENERVFELPRRFISIRLEPAMLTGKGSVQEAIASVEASWNDWNPPMAFEYSFLDDNFYSAFASEQTMGQVLNIFTFIALLIACLGLFGLAAFSAEQKTKELGIRKVLGASGMHLTILFSKEFTRLILVALILAIPLAYYFSNSWLAKFEYRTSVNGWVFFAAAISALLISWLYYRISVY